MHPIRIGLALTAIVLTAINYIRVTKPERRHVTKDDLKRINRMRSRVKLDYDRRFWMADAASSVAQNN